jgi:sodium transport system permease protein
MKNLWSVIKKELKRFFTDKRMLAALILPGVIVYILYSIMGNVMQSTMEGKDHEYVIRVENRPNDPRFLAIETLIADPEVGFKKVTFLDETPEDFEAMIAEKKLDLYVVYNTDFLAKYNANDPNDPPVVTFYYDESVIPSLNAYSTYAGLLNASLQTYVAVTENRSAEGGIDTTIIKGLLPFLLITFIFTGAMAVAPESIAGEKERGTIATLLVTPVKRSTLALGKVTALSIVALVSAASSFLGVMLSLPKMMGSELSLATFTAGTYLAIFAVLIVSMLVFIVLNSIISAYAKSIKEASGLAAPLMMVIMAVGVTTMFGSAATNNALYLIPIYNSVNILLSLFGGEFLVVPFILTMLSNLLLTAGGVYLLTVMFSNEKIMFRK